MHKSRLGNLDFNHNNQISTVQNCRFIFFFIFPQTLNDFSKKIKNNLTNIRVFKTQTLQTIRRKRNIGVCV